MKQIISYLLPMACIVAFSSCGGEKTPQFKDDALIHAKDIKEVKAEKFSDIMEITRIVPLETTEVSLLSNVNKVMKRGGVYYAFTLAKSVTAFDEQGKYLFQIKRIGGGPGEYPAHALTDFDVDDQHIYLSAEQKILVNDLQGQYQYSIDLEDRTYTCKPVEGGFVVKTAQSGGVEFALIDEQGKPMGQKVAVDDIMANALGGLMLITVGQRHIFKHCFTNELTAYDTQTKEFIPMRLFDDDEVLTQKQQNSWSSAEQEFQRIMQYAKEIESGKWTILDGFTYANGQVLVCTDKGKQKTYTVLDVASGKAWRYPISAMKNDLTFIDDSKHLSMHDNPDSFMALIQPYDMKEGMDEHPSLYDEKRNGELKRLLDAVNVEDSNPFIIEYRFKTGK